MLNADTWETLLMTYGFGTIPQQSPKTPFRSH